MWAPSLAYTSGYLPQLSLAFRSKRKYFSCIEKTLEVSNDYNKLNFIIGNSKADFFIPVISNFAPNFEIRN